MEARGNSSLTNLDESRQAGLRRSSSEKLHTAHGNVRKQADAGTASFLWPPSTMVFAELRKFSLSHSTSSHRQTRTALAGKTRFEAFLCLTLFLRDDRPALSVAFCPWIWWLGNSLTPWKIRAPYLREPSGPSSHYICMQGTRALHKKHNIITEPSSRLWFTSWRFVDRATKA